MSTDSWREDALCRQTDPELFHPKPGGTVRPAKETCQACNVRTQCLAYALDTEQTWGVWGGVDQTELRRLIRVRRAASHDTERRTA